MFPALALLLAPVQAPTAQAGSSAVEGVAEGEFDVAVTPEPGSGAIGRMTLAKTFHGDLAATGSGLMLSAGDPRGGSAGYVAMEEVTGTLAGREGRFALQHSGTMDGGTQALSVSVVPGSTAGGLAGLTGTMAIRIEGGKHHYSFRYRLP